MMNESSDHLSITITIYFLLIRNDKPLLVDICVSASPTAITKHCLKSKNVKQDVVYCKLLYLSI